MGGRTACHGVANDWDPHDRHRGAEVRARRIPTRAPLPNTSPMLRTTLLLAPEIRNKLELLANFTAT
jgi:hypothetical protein